MKKLFLLLAVLTVTGCLSRKPLDKQSFAFNIPEANPITVSTNAPVLTIREISVMPPFDSPSLTYRTGEFSYERDAYAAFLASPTASLRAPIQASLRNSGKFFTVSDTESALRSDLDLEIVVTQLYGDFRQKERPTAVLEMGFVLYHAAQLRGAHFSRSHSAVLLQKTYTQRVRVTSRTAAAVMAALNDGLQQIVTRFAEDAPIK